MRISESSNVPDSTYFRTGDAEPRINDDGSITIYDGRGTRRSSWGAPGVTSTVVLEEDDLVAVHVGFYHKHGGGQFWRYYTTDGTTTTQTTWARLPDDIRAKVLAAYEKNRAAWEKAPGKLRSEYAKPSTRKVTAYKLVRLHADGSMSGLYDGTPYAVGKRLVEKARDDHRGGYYAHPSIEQVRALWHSGTLVPEDRIPTAPAMLALIEVELSGTIIRYPNGKMAATYLTPTRVVETIEYRAAA